MDVQIIQKILQQEKLESIFFVNIQYSISIWAFDHTETNILYIVEKSA